MPGAGLEPARGCPQGILSPQCLPFHHLGGARVPNITKVGLKRLFFIILIGMKIKNFTKSVSIIAFLLLSLVLPCSAEVDIDVYHEFREELALVRDGYVTAWNMAIETANENDPEGWAKLHAGNKAVTWAEIEFEAPETTHLKVTEIPNGFAIEGTYDVYKLKATFVPYTKENDTYYNIKYGVKPNTYTKEVVEEVFGR